MDGPLHSHKQPPKQNRTVAFTAAPRLAPLLLQPDTPTPTIALAHDGAALHIHLQQQPLLSLRPGQGPANRGLLFPVRAETGSAADNAAVCHPLARRAMGAVAGRMAAGGGRGSHIGACDSIVVGVRQSTDGCPHTPKHTE